MRPVAIFIALCMVLIAGSAGGVTYLAFAAPAGAAIAVAVAVLAALACCNAMLSAQTPPAQAANQLADLSRASVDLARQFADLSRRQSALEGQMERMSARTRATVEPLASEMGEIGTLIKELADSVAAQEATLAAIVRSLPEPLDAAEVAAASAPVPEAAPQPAAATDEAAAETQTPPVAVIEPSPAPAARAISASKDEEMLAHLRSAIEASRVDLYLQPIVTLPQRKVRYYEAMTRLRTNAGEILPAADFIGPAERGAIMPQIDNLVVFRCVQVIRRLLVKNREIGLFCNLSGATLIDGTVFPQLVEFLDANRALAASVVFEFTQSFLRTAGPIENEAFAALAERGFRLSLDNVTDLRLEPRELAARGFRFIKIPAGLLLGRGGTAAADIHPADLADLLGRFGIDLIAERIESEGMAVDLLDYQVRFGQGFLFSPPRPVRAEALQGIAERGDLVVRESAGTGTSSAAGLPQAGSAGTAAPLAAGKGDGGGLAQLARGRV
jgi:cyclic-di-GMP phosphodiesterase TipF (flagellum assembly factor)